MINIDETIDKQTQDIVRMLRRGKEIDEPIVLVLGARTGWFYGHPGLYEDIKEFSKIVEEFDNLTEMKKFQESYKVMQDRYSEREVYTSLKALLPKKGGTRREDEYISHLIHDGYFSTVISTSIDASLEKAIEPSSDPFYDPQIQQEDYKYKVLIQGSHTQDAICAPYNKRVRKVIKIFGDLDSIFYCSPKNELSLTAPENTKLKGFLEQELSKDILIIGYDPYWDQRLNAAFPEFGKNIFYVNEDPKFEDGNELSRIFGKRGGKLLMGEQYSYKKFAYELYTQLFLEDSPNYAYFRKTSILLPKMYDDIKAINREISSLREVIEKLEAKLPSPRKED